MLQGRAKIISVKLKTAGRGFRFCSSSTRVGGSRRGSCVNLRQSALVYGAVPQDRLQCRRAIARGGRGHLQFRRGRIQTPLGSDRRNTAHDVVNQRFGHAHGTRRCLEGYFAILPDGVNTLILAAILEGYRIATSEERTQRSHKEEPHPNWLKCHIHGASRRALLIHSKNKIRMCQLYERRSVSSGYMRHLQPVHGVAAPERGHPNW